MSEGPNIAGKDYFTEEEAAHYVCVSYSQFRAKALEYGLRSFQFMGKKVYRKTDLQRAMEGVWQRSTGEDLAPTLTGETQTGSTVLASALSRHAKRKQRASQSSSNSKAVAG